MRNLLKIFAGAAALAGVLTFAGCGGAATDTTTADWLTNFDQAVQAGRQNQRLIFVAFVGSDWSVASQGAIKEIFDTKEFKDFADGKLVLLRVDFNRGAPVSEQLKQQNDELAKKAAVDLVPTYLLLDPYQRHVVWQGNGYAANGPGALILQLGNIVAQWQQYLAQNPNAAQSQPVAAPQIAGAPQLPGAQSGTPATGAPALQGVPSVSAQDLARQQAMQAGAIPNSLSSVPSSSSALPGVPTPQDLMRQIEQGSTPSTAPTAEQIMEQIQAQHPSSTSAPAPASSTDSALPPLKQLQ